MKNSGGKRASGGTSFGTLLVLGTAAGALGWAVVYFFDSSRGEERRRRVVEAAQGAMADLSQRLAGAAPAEDPVPEPAVAYAVEPPRDLHEPVREPDVAGALHEKVTFFRLGEHELEEAAVLAPVAVITEELPAGEPRHDPGRHEPAYDPPAAAPAPTIIAYDADRLPEPELETEAEAEAEPSATPRRGRTLLAIAAVLAVLAAAAALGGWAIWSGGDGTKAAEPSTPGEAQLVSLISQPGAQRIPVAGSKGTMVLVTTPSGQAVLVISNLKRAPAGKVYQAWIVKGKTPASAGLFKGGQPQYVIPLSQHVPKGAIFAVTVEKTGGVPAPTQAPEYTAKLS
jgi:anti-sigma-K factor RskA